jgi:hypothetical protein
LLPSLKNSKIITSKRYRILQPNESHAITVKENQETGKKIRKERKQKACIQTIRLKLR